MITVPISLRFPARAVSLALVLGVLAFLAVGCSRGPRFTVVNRSAVVLDDVRLEYSGGSAPIGRLSPGETRSVRITPRGESGLQIGFRDPGGVVHEQKVDVYFETGYRGTLEIAIDQDLNVTWSGTLRP